MYKALNYYFNYLHYSEDLYSDFIYNQYVIRTCFCDYSLRKYGVDCKHCYKYESSREYITNEFRVCIDENHQYGKIVLYDES